MKHFCRNGECPGSIVELTVHAPILPNGGGFIVYTPLCTKGRHTACETWDLYVEQDGQVVRANHCPCGAELQTDRHGAAQFSRCSNGESHDRRQSPAVPAPSASLPPAAA